MSSYHRFSKIYDDLMDDSLYPKWLDYVAKYVNPDTSILELGCGSGRLAELLIEKGYNYAGLDNSNDMLTLAQERVPQALLIERDMTDLEDLPNYDAIISFNDSVCYLPDEATVEKLFQSVYQQLSAKGVFLFDVHSVDKIDWFMTQSFHSETEEGLLVWDSYPGEHEHSVEHDLSMFMLTDSGLYERYNETHYERTYPLERYKAMLKTAGFTSVEVRSDFTDSFDKKGYRWFIKAQK